jgi:hypothetical protein
MPAATPKPASINNHLILFTIAGHLGCDAKAHE